MSMGRPRTQVGDWGTIGSKQIQPGKWRAWTYVRGIDGQRKPLQRFASTKAAAETAVRQAAREAAGKAKAQEGITPETSVAELLAHYIDAAKVAESSRDDYRSAITKYLNPGVGGLTVREATTGRLDTYLTALAETKPGIAKTCRAVLSGAFKIAVRHDAVAVNPVSGTAPVSRKSEPKSASGDDSEPDTGNRAITVAELAALRQRVREWMTAPTQGRPRNQDIADVVDVLSGSGLRVGELLALRWVDVDLSSTPAVLTISGTVKRTSTQGLHRQPETKTQRGYRKIKVPGYVRDVLLRRRVDASSEYVFPSHTGGLQEAANLARAWRDARGEEFRWVTWHTFRKAVGTRVIENGTDRAAMAQLGHSTIVVTESHYVDRAAEAPDNTAILDAFGPSA